MPWWEIPRIEELGLEFGTTGPMVVVHLRDSARVQDENGRVTISFKALTRAVHGKRVAQTRAIVARASELRILTIIAMDPTGVEVVLNNFVPREPVASKMPRSDAERAKDYRDRKKGERHETVTESSRTPDTTAVTSDVYIEEDKKEKEKNFSSSAIALCDALALQIINNGSKPPSITDPWLKAAELLLGADERPLEEAAALIEWCQQDEFWKGNVLSMPTFRKQYDKLRLASKRGQRHLRPVDSVSDDLAEFQRLAEEARQRDGGDAA